MIVEMMEAIPDSYNGIYRSNPHHNLISTGISQNLLVTSVFMNGFNAENGVPHAFAGPTGFSHPAGDVRTPAIPTTT